MLERDVAIDRLEGIMARDYTDVYITALESENARLLELCKAFESYLDDDSRSERRRLACLADVRQAISQIEAAHGS